MRSSGAPDNVNTRSIEQFIFSPRDVCALKKMIQARLPRSFILTLTLSVCSFMKGTHKTDFHTERRCQSMATGDGDGAPSGSIPSLVWLSHQQTKTKDSHPGRLPVARFGCYLTSLEDKGRDM